MSEQDSLRLTVEGLLGRAGAHENEMQRFHNDLGKLDDAVAQLRVVVNTMAGDLRLVKETSSTKEQYLELSHGTRAIDTKVSSIDKAVAGLTETLNQSLRQKSEGSSFWVVFDKFKEVIAIVGAGIGLYFALRYGGHA